MASGLIALSACGSGDDSDGSAKSPVPTSSAPAPETSSASADTQKQAKDAVLQAYEDFWAEQVKAYAKGDTAGTSFAQYAAGEALSSTQDDLKDLHNKGIVTTGAPSHDTTVVSLEPGKKVPSAKLTDCLDSTDWKFIYRKSGNPVEMPESRLIRYVTRIDAEKWGQQWKIVDVTPEQRAC
ncbi:hypothetical protein [Streptomyces sp. SLBN-115]|uniref:hypothetical protein n=1 Tax=Streptomyces sp. SLBN-115 TaxID=2768453 RepID=UPI00114EECA5|nr:hypothetical protein [Streptomyces sp. SLBN-115]TQJ37841.1 hypothetical protein FBY34_8005 [Streptomyces sp. SLBN-115]